MREKIEKIIPRYAIMPLTIIFVMNLATYYLTRLYTNQKPHYFFNSALDQSIPFIPEFIIFYVLAYIQWFVGFIAIARESREICYHYLGAEFIAKFLCFLTFMIFPTMMVRPDVSGTGLCVTLVELIYVLDTPVNLFPSIHCLASWLCFRASGKLTKMPKAYPYISLVFTLLVCASTVLIKQHNFVDIIGGILYVEIGLLIVKACKQIKILNTQKISER